MQKILHRAFFENNSTQVYSAFAVGNSTTVGIEITSTGFTCKNGSNYTSHGATPYLNKPGIRYWYEATKRKSDFFDFFEKIFLTNR